MGRLVPINPNGSKIGDRIKADSREISRLRSECQNGLPVAAVYDRRIFFPSKSATVIDRRYRLTRISVHHYDHPAIRLLAPDLAFFLRWVVHGTRRNQELGGSKSA